MNRLERGCGVRPPVSIPRSHATQVAVVALLGSMPHHMDTLALLTPPDGSAPALIHLGDDVLCYRAPAFAYTGADQIGSRCPRIHRPLEVCGETGMVNRFHGLRGGPRLLCERALNGAEPRLRLHREGTAGSQDVVAGVDLVVHAPGYRTARIR